MGAGKSTLINLILGKLTNYVGNIVKPKDLKISYVGQDISGLKGNLKEYIIKEDIDEHIFKSTLINLILGKLTNYVGNIVKPEDLKISYVGQDISGLKGSLKEYILKEDIDENIFKSTLARLNFPSNLYNIDIEKYSDGQKKKIMIASSLSKKAHIFIWDEPLNYIDVMSRIQLEELILSTNPTLIFIEHDEEFTSNIRTKEVEL